MKKIVYKVACVPLLVAAVALGVWQTSEACTRILWNNNKIAVLVSRTMDWPQSTEPELTVFPRGMHRDGGLLGPARIIKENPATWTSKYASLVTSVYGLGSADGLNERGLGGHMLFLNAADFGPRDVSTPGIHGGCGCSTFWITRRLSAKRWPCWTICRSSWPRRAARKPRYTSRSRMPAEIPPSSSTSTASR